MSEQKARCEGGCGIEGPHERDEYCPAPERPDKCPTCGIAREHDGPHYYEALKQAGKPMCPDTFHDPTPDAEPPSPDKVRGIRWCPRMDADAVEYVRADKLDRLEQRINRLERVVLELASRPLPGHDFHHPPWPPEGELGDIHKLHHTEGTEGRDTNG